MRRAVAVAVALLAAAAAAMETRGEAVDASVASVTSVAPIAPIAATFSDAEATDLAPASVHAETENETETENASATGSEFEDGSASSGAETAPVSEAPTLTQTPPAASAIASGRSMFDLTRSAASTASVDILELVRTDVADAPIISFEALPDKSAWEVAKWDDPLTQLANMITNDRIVVAGDEMRVGVMLLDQSNVTKVSFAKKNAWHFGPTLVLRDQALAGLRKLEILEFSNFNVSFDGAKWLPAQAKLNKLAFEKTNVTGFAVDPEVQITDAVWRESSVDHFPTSLLTLRTPLKTLIVESCVLSAPFTLSREQLAVLRKIPNVALSGNQAPQPQDGACDEEVAFKGATICVQGLAVEGADEAAAVSGIEGDESAKRPFDRDATQAPYASTDSKLTSSNALWHTVVAAVCVIGGVLLVAGFVLVRRRSANNERTEPENQLTFADKHTTFLPDEEEEPHSEAALSSVGERETVVSPEVAELDLGIHAVTIETKLGVNGLWRAEYREGPVVVLRVDKSRLREEGRSFDTVTRSFLPLQHPSIAQLVGTSLSGIDEVLLVVEHMAKGSLRSALLKRKIALSWDKTVDMSLQIASGLAFVHSVREGFVSRNLTSKSVLCDADMNCKLDIFDFAESTRDHIAPVHTYGLGDIAYRAPELLRGEAVSRAAEVYALGVIFCELSLQAPVYASILQERGTTVGEIFIAREVAAHRLRPEPMGDTPVTYYDVIAACLSVDPAKRPSMTEVVEWLRRTAAVSVDSI